MDAVRKQTQAECEDVFANLPVTIQALLPAVLAHKDKILSVERKTYQYGGTDRHQLDIYYPPTSSASPRPILFWAYGGGFVSGERVLPESQGLVHTTIGAFFARKGFVVVIPDYRLAPSAQFPAQAEDIRDAILWVIQHASSTLSTPSVKLDAETLVAMGHSAGAVNVATAYLLPEILQGTDIARRTKALVLQSGLYVFEIDGVAPAVPPPVLAQYFGPTELQKKREPLALLRALSDEQVSALPLLLLVDAEKEPQGVVRSEELFRQLWKRRRDESEVLRIVARGHNHISVNWVLGTGDGEEWAEEVAKWLGDTL
ncbi:alpha/beta-hydrolase [Punctularia strigosozonata HHB-11173 SS5]|uniref:Alpha/beta-hydrolase n=1 Tax=Punctularia strigosozonata (strain HHB-11173) TaxID=741275 RepID=R7S3J7_PUNST|nr:alpha/beta-hydrolase [Punctularia strigosozonata HHB-11173 SS5]EIN03791.1 alpha/beta-hydrolase [Punctularia strigosozonata HHB-11173 SS5]